MNYIASQPAAIVITGVTRGLGRAMVDEFVRLGHRVSGCARTKEEIQELTRMYPTHDFHTVDVASDAEVRPWAEHVLRQYGPPDFVLNNAAVINLKASLWEVEDREFSYEIDINIKGVANVIRHFVPSMITRKRGVIVNFSSRWGRKFEKQMAPYCATKWAVLALTRVLAEELKSDGVAAIAINPGIVKTRMLQRYLGCTASLDATSYLTPAEWAKIAVPQILRLRLRDTGMLRNIVNHDLNRDRSAVVLPVKKQKTSSSKH
jgi:NAD(P)-dependent dehydrogenase (short-subunit alcohol dehydrogenase family)